MKAATYQITERINANKPDDNDPLARAMSRFSGTFDLRKNGTEIIMTGTSLKTFRALQARWNSVAFFNGAF